MFPFAELGRLYGICRPLLPGRQAALLSLLIAMMAPIVAVAAPPRMTVPGQSNVGSTGAFSYSIPIAVPPGTAGIVPSLSLSYSSQSGDGILGLGWGLGGLSTIARCPQTIAQDNVHGGVNYQLSDRFCIDGQRLILIGGTYGQAGSVYRTEIDQFSKITAYGTAGNGPAYFEVQRPSGLTFEYGNTTSSQILAVGTSTARAWALDQVSDPKGNYYKVAYTNDTTNGQFYPARIDYTGSSGHSTYNSVQFSYTTRPDIVPTYQAGSIIQTTVLMTDVKTYNGSSVVLDYRIGYTPASSGASHDELNSVTQCDGSGNCLAPTTFGWQGSRDNPSMTTNTNTNALTNGQQAVFGDFNGDGLIDIATVNTSSCPTNAIYLGSQSGTFSASSMTANYSYSESGSTSTFTYSGAACFYLPAQNTPPTLAVGDVNGDGLTDIAFNAPHWQFLSPPPTWFPLPFAAVLINSGAGSLVQANTPFSQFWPFIYSPPFFPSDFNGDGRADGFSSTSGTVYGWMSNGSGGFVQDSGHSVPTTATTFLTGDFDGDGCTDILAQGGGTGQIDYFCQPAVSSTTVPDWSTFQTVVGDFNGDGKSDVIVLGGRGQTLFLSTGTGFATGIGVTGGPSVWSSYTAIVGDFNGDGKDDILLVSHTSGTPHVVLLSTGTGFIQVATIPNTSTSATAVVADLNNDGALDFLMQNIGTDTEYLFGYVPELITSVSNGVGATTTVAYDRLNHATIYTKGSGASYPTQDVIGPQYAVSQLTTSNGIGGTRSWSYAYAGLKKDLQGRGFLGFSHMVVTDQQTGIVTTTDFETAFPETGLISDQSVVSGSVQLKYVQNTWTATNEGGSSPGSAYYFVSLQQSQVSGADLDGTVLPETTTSLTYDAYGNALTKTTCVSVSPPTCASTSTTTNTYNNDTTDWFLGQLQTTQTENVVGASDLTRHMSVAWSATNKPNQFVLEQGNAALSLTTGIGYDSRDNANSQTLSGSGITTRTSGQTFDSNGVFPTTITNALSQSDTIAYNPAFGGVTSLTDPNSLTGTTGYDTFGRTTSAVRPDGNRIVASYAYCAGVNGGTASCPTYGAYLAQSTPENPSGGQNGPTVTTYYDALGRAIETQTQGFDGSLINAATQYDSLGRVHEASRPYFASGGTPKWTSYTYDILARVTLATFPDTSTKTFAYHGLTSSVTNGLSQTTTTVLNPQGLVASRTDANSKTTSFVYDAFGDLLTVTDPSSHTITNTFDLRGRKTASSDPDMGSWSYVYDVLSELTSQTDAKSQTTTLSYDLLGRITNRTEPSLVSNWVYDAASHGIGALASACTGSGCTSPGTSTYFRQMSYDSYARPASVALTTPAASGTYNYSYDVNGNISQVLYPSGFAANYSYTSLGYATKITDGALYTAYWTAITRDAELHLTKSTAGNGVVTNQSFDANTGRLLGICATPDAGTCDGATAKFSYTWDFVGNLKTRADTNDSVAELYCYDVLNRLTNSATGISGALPSSCTASGTNIIDKAIAFDNLGDITSKSDVGSYSYGSGAGPHAVTSITGSYLGLTNPVLGYDANGNMTCVSSASGCIGTIARQVTYTSFNMAGSITQGATTIGLTYDSEHSRIVQTIGSTTTTYLNDPVAGAMSEAATTGGTTVWRDYIAADGQIVTLRTTSPATGTAMNWGMPNNWGIGFNWHGLQISVLYFTTDHLGSTSVLTDPSHVVQERDSYDAWGKRRNANGTDNTACSITSLTTRGFTGQEMMDAVCEINLNARIYDPTIARMTAADPIVPNPMNGQTYNRYSYVNNRPLSGTDPTGYWMLGGVYGSGPITIPGPGKSNDDSIPGTGSVGAIYGFDVTMNDLVPTGWSGSGIPDFAHFADPQPNGSTGSTGGSKQGPNTSNVSNNYGGGTTTPPSTTNSTGGATASSGANLGSDVVDDTPPPGAVFNPDTGNFTLPDGSTWTSSVTLTAPSGGSSNNGTYYQGQDNNLLTYTNSTGRLTAAPIEWAINRLGYLHIAITHIWFDLEGKSTYPPQFNSMSAINDLLTLTMNKSAGIQLPGGNWYFTADLGFYTDAAGTTTLNTVILKPTGSNSGEVVTMYPGPLTN